VSPWAASPPLAFGYRSLLLDVARHFHPVEDIKWLIDRMAGAYTLPLLSST